MFADAGPPLVLMALGLVLWLAVTATVAGLSIQTVGVILFLLGVVWLVVEMLQARALTRPRRDADRPAERGAEAPAAKAGPGVGAKVGDGQFELGVTGVERPGASMPGQFGTTEKAQGEFVIVRVNVTNVGNEGQTLMSTGQKLFNDKNQSFEPSSAILSLKDAEKFFLQNINPGNSVKGAPLLFDVAPGTKLASIELHDSPFSGGVKVALK